MQIDISHELYGNNKNFRPFFFDPESMGNENE